MKANINLIFTAQTYYSVKIVKSKPVMLWKNSNANVSTYNGGSNDVTTRNQANHFHQDENMTHPWMPRDGRGVPRTLVDILETVYMRWDISPEWDISREWDSSRIMYFTFWKQIVYMRMNSSHSGGISLQRRWDFTKAVWFFSI